MEDKDPLHRYVTNELEGQYLLKILFLRCRDIEVFSYLFQNCCLSDSQSREKGEEAGNLLVSGTVIGDQ